MELLYAYAEKYRIFEHQEFSFSDKFRVHFNEEKRTLTIRRNEDYFDLYPGNILGITAVVGKNASGKTSLLSLIGDRMETRNLTEGMDPSAPERYFMIHWLGQDEDGRDTFLFETNNCHTYCDLFEKITPELKVKTAGVRRVRCLENGKLLSVGAEPVWNYPVQMLFFRNGTVKERSSWDLHGRKEVPLVLHSLYQELELLTDRIRHNGGRESMFGNDNYHCRTRIALPTDPISSVQYTYRSSSQDQERLLWWIQNILSVPKRKLPEFLAYGLAVEQQLFCIRQANELSEEILNRLPQIGRETETRQPLEGMMYANQQLSKLKIPGQQPFGQWQNTWEQAQDSGYIHKILIPLLHSLASHCTMSRDVSGSGDKILFDFDLRIDADTDFRFLQVFFEEMELSGYSENWVRTEIGPLSDGERENLAMYASIHEQLTNPNFNSGSYTLLFDEIERCMHPEMCRCLITDLMEFLRGYPDKQFQIIIASHSPFIAGDLRQENLIRLTKDGEVERQEDSPFGQNIHTLLKSQFFLDNTFSGYACTMIDLVADCLASREEEGRETWNSLEEMREKICGLLGKREDCPWKRIPSDDRETLQFLEQIIGAVGEPLLRRSLQENLERWKNRNDTRSWKEARREVLMKQLEQLNAELGIPQEK